MDVHVTNIERSKKLVVKISRIYSTNIVRHDIIHIPYSPMVVKD